MSAGVQQEQLVKQDGGEAQAADNFVRYYAEQSISETTLQRFRSIQGAVMRLRRQHGLAEKNLDIADIGCNAGTQSILWAKDGHRVHGIDINGPLLDLATKRSSEAGLEIDFRLGSATALPWADGSMDVCLVPELLEHVADWKSCLNEATRILRPGGVVYLSTTNRLCPRQQEFNLPMYSWYPAPLKRHYEKLSVTRRPDLVNYAKYPAVNWFTFYGLRRELVSKGFVALDRFDITDTQTKGLAGKVLISLIRGMAPLRWMAHVATPYTVIMAVRKAGPIW